MLNHDEEEILKVLLNLYKEQNARDISGSFKDFPVKYQICYKEIISRLDDKQFVANFVSSVVEDFVITLMPPALTYFQNKAKKVEEEESGLCDCEEDSGLQQLETFDENEIFVMDDNEDKKIKQVKETKEIKSDTKNEKEIKETKELKEQKNDKEKDKSYVVPALGINLKIRLVELEKQAEVIGREDKEELKSVIEDLKKIFEKLKTNPVIKPNKSLIERITKLSGRYPWLYGEILNILGTLMARILMG